MRDRINKETNMSNLIIEKLLAKTKRTDIPDVRRRATPSACT